MQRMFIKCLLGTKKKQIRIGTRDGTPSLAKMLNAKAGIQEQSKTGKGCAQNKIRKIKANDIGYLSTTAGNLLLSQYYVSNNLKHAFIR